MLITYSVKIFIIDNVIADRECRVGERDPWMERLAVSDISLE